MQLYPIFCLLQRMLHQDMLSDLFQSKYHPTVGAISVAITTLVVASFGWFLLWSLLRHYHLKNHALAAAAAAAAGGERRRPRGRRQRDASSLSLIPIVTEYPPLEFLTRAFREQGPSFLLQTARKLRSGTSTTKTKSSVVIATADGADDDAAQKIKKDSNNNNKKTIPVFEFPDMRILPFLPPPFRLFLVGDHRIARTILEQPAATKPPLFYDFFNECLGGDGFFSANGHRSAHARRAVAAALGPRHLQRMTDVIESILDEWIAERFSPQPSFTKDDDIGTTGAPAAAPVVEMDMHREMVGLTTDIIGRVGFDHVMTPEERATFEENLMLGLKAHYFKTNPLKKWWATSWMFPEIRRAFRATEQLMETAHQMLSAYRSRCSSDRLPDDDDSPIHHTILAMIANNPEYRSDRQRASDILTFFFAGFETTASALEWTFLELARHPAEQVKLRQALRQCSNDDERRHCPALRHVTREILRLYPPAALGSIRQTAVDVVVPYTTDDDNDDDDTETKTTNHPKKKETMIIPAGSMCLMPFYVILRDGSVFDNPDVFLPSRWENDDPTSSNSGRTSSECRIASLLPFAAGPRSCVGRALAHAEMSSIVSRLVSSFEFSVVDEGHPTYFVTLRVEGMKLAVKPLPSTH